MRQRVRKFAQDTKVPASQTRGEIEDLLTKRKARAVAVFNSVDSVAVVFEMGERRIIFRLQMPGEDEARERRRRWRALLLTIKAKLAAVDDGIETFDEAFLAHIVMPDGLTVAEHTLSNIESAYKGGPMQPLLPPPRGKP